MNFIILTLASTETFCQQRSLKEYCPNLIRFFIPVEMLLRCPGDTKNGGVPLTAVKKI